MNTFGRLFRLTTFGESHGPALGAVIDGCPAGVALPRERVQAALDRRRPGQSALTTSRQEPDSVELLSGVYEDKTLGTPIAAIVRNQDQRSQDYAPLQKADRPGHADAVWRERFKHRDHRGGGRTSGRETLSRVIGGAVADALLERDLPECRIVAWVSQIGPHVAAAAAPTLRRSDVDAHPTRMPDVKVREIAGQAIADAKVRGDSFGGTIDLRVVGLPVGLGEPVFAKLKSELAGAFSSIGAVAGVQWGNEQLLESLSRPGSEFHQAKSAYGGIQGGLANGEPVEARVLFKPPATLGDLAKAGRHDPCILPRAVPVIEAMASLVIADLYLHFAARRHLP